MFISTNMHLPMNMLTNTFTYAHPLKLLVCLLIDVPKVSFPWSLQRVKRVMFETPTARKPGSHLAIQNILFRLPALAKPISRVWEGVSPQTWVPMGCVVLTLMTMTSFKSREIFSLGDRPRQPGAGGSSGVKWWLCFRVTQGEVIPADEVAGREPRLCRAAEGQPLLSEGHSRAGFSCPISSAWSPAARRHP